MWGRRAGDEVAHRGKGGSSPRQRVSEVGEVVKVWSAPASPSPITSPPLPLSIKKTIKQQQPNSAVEHTIPSKFEFKEAPPPPPSMPTCTVTSPDNRAKRLAGRSRTLSSVTRPHSPQPSAVFLLNGLSMETEQPGVSLRRATGSPAL